MADRSNGPGRRPGAPARHEAPAIDEAALVTARHADRLLAGVREAGVERWIRFLEPLPDQLRDADVRSLRGVAARARAAFGPKDSIRDDLSPELTEPFREAIDRLLRELARAEDGR